MELNILEKKDSKQMSKYVVWRVVLKLMKEVMNAVEKALFFSGHRLTFRFPPFYLVGSEILFSIGSEHWHIWRVWDGGGDGIKIVTLPPLSAWGLSSR